MKKSELRAKVQKMKTETGIALQTVFDALNQGQRKKIIKDATVKALFDRYGVDYGGEV